MGFLSQAGWVGFRTQSAAGSYADPGAVAPNQGVYIKTRSGSMGTNRDLIMPDPEIGGNRDIIDAQLGPASFSGSYDFYARPESLAWLFKVGLGTAAAPSGSGATGYTHLLTPTDTTLPWVSIEEQIANAFNNLKYTDAKLNTLHYEADANGYMMGSAAFVSKTQATDSSPTASGAQRWDTAPLMVGPNISVTYNAVTLPAKSFKFDLNNNIEDTDFRLGSLFLGDVTEKRREITMGLTVRPADASLWKQATWGTSGATVLGGTKTSQQAVVTITTYDDIPGATAGIKYAISFTIPSAVIKPFNVNPSGDDVLEHDLEIQMLRPTSTAGITVSVKNSFATLP